MTQRILTALLLIIIIFLLAIPITNNPPQSKERRTFRHSKILALNLYKNHRETFYCGCKFNIHRKIDLNSCGYKIRKNAFRAKRLEWEHIVPASFFGHDLHCWETGGRNKCSTSSTDFSNFEGDLHNLFPSIGEINADRSNIPHGETTGQSPYGSCDIIINRAENLTQPRKMIRGDIARVWLYMARKYNMRLSDSQIKTYQRWSRDDPPDEFEIWKNEQIKTIQGDGNPFIDDYH